MSIGRVPTLIAWNEDRRFFSVGTGNGETDPLAFGTGPGFCTF